MAETFELRKARLVNFITELQNIIDGHKISDRVKSRLLDIRDDALDELDDLENNPWLDK